MGASCAGSGCCDTTDPLPEDVYTVNEKEVCPESEDSFAHYEDEPDPNAANEHGCCKDYSERHRKCRFCGRGHEGGTVLKVCIQCKSKYKKFAHAHCIKHRLETDPNWFRISCPAGHRYGKEVIPVAQSFFDDLRASGKIKLKNQRDVAQFIHTLSKMYFHSGDHENMLKITDTAVTWFQKHYGEDSIEVGKLLFQKGSVLLELEKHSEAIILFEQNLSIERREHGHNHFSVAGAYFALGFAHSKLHMSSDAIHNYKNALDILEKIDKPESKIQMLSATLSHLGGEYQKIEAYADYREICLRCLELNEHIYGPNHPNVAVNLSHLAATQLKLGDQEGQVELYERALKIFQKHYEDDHKDVRNAKRNLALAKKRHSQQLFSTQL